MNTTDTPASALQHRQDMGTLSLFESDTMGRLRASGSGGEPVGDIFRPLAQWREMNRENVGGIA
jgi:hypothetical protein